MRMEGSVLNGVRERYFKRDVSCRCSRRFGRGRVFVVFAFAFWSAMQFSGCGDATGARAVGVTEFNGRSVFYAFSGGCWKFLVIVDAVPRFSYPVTRESDRSRTFLNYGYSESEFRITIESIGDRVVVNGSEFQGAEGVVFAVSNESGKIEQVSVRADEIDSWRAPEAIGPAVRARVQALSREGGALADALR